MKYVRILGFVAILGLAIFVSYQAYLYFGRGTVSVSAKPTDASIVVDKRVYTTKDAQDITLTPGEHQIIIALDGFKTIEQTVTMGWQDQQTFNYQLTPRSFKDIYQNLSSDVSYTNYDVAQPQFFLNNTWAAAYIVDGGEGEDVSVAVIHRVNGAWRLVLHDHQLPADAKTALPTVVYDYIKDFQ